MLTARKNPKRRGWLGSLRVPGNRKQG